MSVSKHTASVPVFGKMLGNLSKHFVLPDFFFHVTIVYALLRYNGVDLGKRDFLDAH